MRILDLIAILILVFLLFSGLYLLWQNLPTEPVEFQEYRAQVEQDLPSQSIQFYPNMRFPDSQITYSLSESCSQKKKSDFKNAVKILQASTILKFVEIQDTEAQIRVTCSNLAPEPAQEGHFIAGEGGPSLFLNSTKYSIILKGEVALYRADSCETPQISTHELLHALGFDHNKNQDSIMYPITNCKQNIDKYITDEINRLYGEPSLPDLEIESLEANKSGRYLNFEVTIANIGLKNMKNSTLQVSTNSEIVENFDIGELDIGSKRHLSVKNLRLPKNSGNIDFIVKTTQIELDKKNNQVTIAPKATS